MGIGSTGMYTDDNDNVYAAQVVDKSWRVENGVKVLTGNLELWCTFRDGTQRLVSNVDPAKLADPA
jgi:hypothetical protein